jgi:DNA-binding GntR family transcriptional regulator
MITRRHPQHLTEQQLLDRICREYLALPGLRLTPTQVERIWGVSASTCHALLRRLTDDRFLVRRADGTYARADVAASMPAAGADAFAP